MNDRQALIEFTDATGVGICQGPFANECCGEPGCGYGSRRARQPMAHRPPERSRFLDVGSRLLAVAALVAGLIAAGSVALRAL